MPFIPNSCPPLMTINNRRLDCVKTVPSVQALVSRKSVLKWFTCHTFSRMQYLDHVQRTVTEGHRVTCRF